MRSAVMSCGLAVVCSAACASTDDKVRSAPHTGPGPTEQVADSSAASPLAAGAASGVSDPDLAALLRDHWEWWMTQSPTWATTLGDHRYDDRLDPSAPADLDAARRARRAFLARARSVDRDALGPADRITLDLFIERAEAEIASEVCEFESWVVSPRNNPVQKHNYLPEQHRIRTAEDARNLLARYRGIARSVDDRVAHLERGAAAGRFSNAESVRRTIDMIDRQLARPVAEWALMAPLADARRVLGRDAGQLEQLAQFERELARVVAGEVKPAYRRYRDFLAERIAPRARAGDRVGLVGLPEGRACYRARIRAYLGLDKRPGDLHQLGLAEVQRINDDMRALGAKLFGTRDLAEILARLRGDESLYFDSAGELMRAAEAALADAEAAVPEVFGILPRADCEVVPIPDYEAPYTTIAYYRRPHYDGSKPGEYFINLYQPHTRPRFELRVLTFHESVPGHHLQLAIAQERADLPAWRRLTSNTAFVEGWALYTETLAGELGLYPSDLDRMGMLSFDAWRASRLVVDTGIHAMGWTREDAEAFMRAHTALSPSNISNEVDRYISWPGQALAYKVGQLEILRLRRWARDELGPDFSLAAFHDAVLEHGGVSLPVLARNIAAWVASHRR